MSTEYDKLQDARLKKLEDKVFSTDPPPIPPTCGPDPDPTDEHIAHGGWGGDLGSPETWDAVPMKDDPKLFKVVDKAGTNIAHNFASEAEAEKYIKYHQCIKEGGDTDPDPDPCPAGQHKDATGKCVPDVIPPPGPGPAGATPYPIKGTPMKSEQKGPLTRHYASGKPDDNTIEMNTKSIKFENYQAVVDITNDCVWEHDDNFSIKLGGRHMNGGWFDNSLSVFTGKTGLGTEKKHPSTQLFIVKGPAVGDTRGKRFQYACTYFTATNKLELWTNMGDGWKKNVEGVDVGGFNPKTPEDEFQLRIDGFKDIKKPPTIHSAIVTEI
jgi:hypothetical protein